MDYQPTYLERWTLPESYFGEHWPDYYRSGVGQSRDSGALERSNFAEMLSLLGGESETVIVVRESHWAVGWVEWIAIHYTDETALRAADEANERLEDYPALNEDAWLELEREEADDIWLHCYNVRERIDYIREHRDQFEFNNYADMIHCVRGNYFNGYASDLIG